MSYKRQYTILEVLKSEKKLKIRNNVTNEEFIVNQSDANKTKKKNQGELIESYLISYPKADTDEVLKETGLSNSIYVNKIRKKLRRL